MNRTKEKRAIEEGGSLLNARFFNSLMAREEVRNRTIWFGRDFRAAYIQARFEAIRGRTTEGQVP